MSKFEDGSYGSLTGVSLIGKVLAGRCSMKYTRAAAGSGQIPEGMTPKTMTGPAGICHGRDDRRRDKPRGRRVPSHGPNQERQCGDGLLPDEHRALR